jgi:hypothetical protein
LLGAAKDTAAKASAMSMVLAENILVRALELEELGRYADARILSHIERTEKHSTYLSPFKRVSCIKNS